MGIEFHNWLSDFQHDMGEIGIHFHYNVDLNKRRIDVISDQNPDPVHFKLSCFRILEGSRACDCIPSPITDLKPPPCHAA